jgi:hypothetical protein
MARKGGPTLVESVPLPVRTAHRSPRLVGAQPLLNLLTPDRETGEPMSSLDVRLFSVSSKPASMVRPILTLSVVFALIFVALAASI